MIRVFHDCQKKTAFPWVKDLRLVDEQKPLMFLTARTQNDDVIRGPELGADDYLKKPFSMEELILRLRSLVRRLDKPIALTPLR